MESWVGGVGRGGLIGVSGWSATGLESGSSLSPFVESCEVFAPTAYLAEFCVAVWCGFRTFFNWACRQVGLSPFFEGWCRVVGFLFRYQWFAGIDFFVPFWTVACEVNPIGFVDVGVLDGVGDDVAERGARFSLGSSWDLQCSIQGLGVEEEAGEPGCGHSRNTACPVELSFADVVLCGLQVQVS
mgnify:CR=1 FL=1